MRKTNWLHVGLCTGLLLSGGAALAQGSAPQPQPQPGQAEKAKSSDQEFLNRALRLNQLELRLGRLASERGSTPDVKSMGNKMVQKHSDFGRQLTEQARRAGITETPELTPEQQEAVTRLEGLSGPEFDSALKQTIDGIHRKELAMYQEEATRAEDPQLRALAQTRVDNLQKMMGKQPEQPEQPPSKS
ncbi:MAG: DUF4142 domain-containing protein [Kofleriaceae bacterium]